jgi:hypothetical protein
MEMDDGRQGFHDLDGDSTSKNLQNTQGNFTLVCLTKRKLGCFMLGSMPRVNSPIY